MIRSAEVGLTMLRHVPVVYAPEPLPLVLSQKNLYTACDSEPGLSMPSGLRLRQHSVPVPAQESRGNVVQAYPPATSLRQNPVAPSRVIFEVLISNLFLRQFAPVQGRCHQYAQAAPCPLR
jgi:hypothetical protein